MGRAGKISHWLGIVALLGAMVYLGQSVIFAHSLPSIGDEGAYLYKGYAFARGEFKPFQDYGYWTNKSPLAFLIPGYIQLWFGPGLREARYFAILLSLLMLAGAWITANRIGGRPWAALAVWVFALSDAHVGTYSMALSQGLVACMMSWMLVCVVGRERPLWQLVLGSILSSLVVMTRQNMAPVPVLLVLYIFWQHGKKAGFWALVSSAIVFVGFHVLYWPNILQLWALWLPDSMTPFLDAFRPFAENRYDLWVVEDLSRIQSVATGIRDHFFILCGFFCAWALIPTRTAWKSDDRFKTAVFLGTMYLSLFLLHAWGSLFNQFCVQCFSSYQMFHSTAGLMFVVAVFSNGVVESKPRRALLAAILLFFAGGLGLYYFQRWGDCLLSVIRIPLAHRWITQDKFSWATLRDILTYQLDLTPDVQKRVASIVGGILIGLLILLIAWAIRRWYHPGGTFRQISAAQLGLSFILIVGSLLPPALRTSISSADCTMNFLSRYEQAGHLLANALPADALVYWEGSGRHLGLLLYVDDVRVFPPQITAGAGLMLGGDSDRLLRMGLYNEEMDLQWREPADLFIIWKNRPNIELDDFQNHPAYQAIPFSLGDLDQCEDKLFLFRKSP